MTALQVRTLPSIEERQRPAPRRIPPPLVPLIGVLAAVSLFAWPGPRVETPTPLTLSEPVMSLAAPEARIAPPASVRSFESFVSALNRGDTDATIALLAPQLPEVAGLGTFTYPLAKNAGLWDGGELDAISVAGLVEKASGIPGPVVISNCSAFGDGPKVTIVACDYTAVGLILLPSFRPELGTLFGFMVDSAVAGVTYTSGATKPGPIP